MTDEIKMRDSYDIVKPLFESEHKPSKALSGYAEWFWLMAMNIKPVENRDWSLTKYLHRDALPIRIYLHASKTKASKDEVAFIRKHLKPEQLQRFDSVDWSKYRGHIIGEITIYGEIVSTEGGYIAGSNKAKDAICSGWFFGTYGFLVRDGVLFDTPIPYKGQLGFFNVALPKGGVNV